MARKTNAMLQAEIDALNEANNHLRTVNIKLYQMVQTAAEHYESVAANMHQLLQSIEPAADIFRKVVAEVESIRTKALQIAENKGNDN